MTGRRAIGVDQQPGGTFYPLVRPPEGLGRLFADLSFEYPDEQGAFELPLRISWTAGFGEDPPIRLTGIDYQGGNELGEAPFAGSSVPGSPVVPLHTYDLEIQDSLGIVVFSTLTANHFRSTDWSSRIRILEWADQFHVLRVVIHTAWGPNDVPHDFPEYAEFEPAIPLDERTLLRRGFRLKSIQVEGAGVLEGLPIRLQAGYNTTLELEPSVARDGRPVRSVLTVNFPPGKGLGRAPVECEETVELKTINHVGPDEGGRFSLGGEACTLVESPFYRTRDAATDTTPRMIELRDNVLQLRDDCEVCSTCEDFIAVYEAIRRLRNRAADILLREQTALDLYRTIRTRFLNQKECREAQSLRLKAETFCPCIAGFSAGFINRTDDCLRNVVLHLSFVYTDDEGSGVEADSNPSSPTVLPNTVFYGGFVDPERHRSVTRESYRLGGSWPNYFVYFPQVNRGQRPYVTWHMQFEGCDASQRVELVADVYAVDAGYTVPDYTPGLGPVGPGAYPFRLVTIPQKTAIGLLPTCE